MSYIEIKTGPRTRPVCPVLVEYVQYVCKPSEKGTGQATKPPREGTARLDPSFYSNLSIKPPINVPDTGQASLVGEKIDYGYS